MADPLVEELSEHFVIPAGDIAPVVLSELQSILRIHQLSPEDLSFKWESYCMKMGPETELGIKTVRDFKKDLQDALERESREKTLSKGGQRGMNATPRVGKGGDVFGMLDALVPNTPRTAGQGGSAVKRKGAFATPSAKANKSHAMSSPSGPGAESTPVTTFSDRKDSGSIQESLNNHIELPPPSDSIPSEARIKPKSNTDIRKFNYKTMAMKLSEASEILDDRIEEFVNLIQAHHSLEDSAFGNPAAQSQNEIVAVGRIASDSSEGRLMTSSLVLETSRRMGAGHRVPLRVDKLPGFAFFAGKIVALRGSNASGTYFSASEVLDTPPQPTAATAIESLDVINDRIAADNGITRPLVTLVASGPYTTETDLDYSPFAALLSAAEEAQADALVLCGPFVDNEHPLVRSGDFDLPADYAIEPDRATVTDLFKANISSPLNKLVRVLPNILIIICPSIRDAISSHAAWPQDRFVRQGLALPKQVQVVSNPMLLSLNEAMFGVSSLDVLQQIQATQVIGGQVRQQHILELAVRQVIEQRHFFPVFPPTESRKSDDTDGVPFQPLGPSLDTSYLKLGEFVGAKPDVLVTPSNFTAFAKVIEGVLAINPGRLSKAKGPGTYARMVMEPLVVTDAEREKGEDVAHRVYERCRVDIVKI